MSSWPAPRRGEIVRQIGNALRWLEDVADRAEGQLEGPIAALGRALNELGDIERAVAAGTDDFLCKPVNKLELVKRVENMLKLRHVTDENERLRRYIDDMEDTSGPQNGG